MAEGTIFSLTLEEKMLRTSSGIQLESSADRTAGLVLKASCLAREVLVEKRCSGASSEQSNAGPILLIFYTVKVDTW